MSETWFQHNNVANKLKQALEGVIVGQGLHIIFDGLEKGKCLVEVTYDGETCGLFNKNPPLTTQKRPENPLLLSVEEAMDTGDLPDDPLVVQKYGKKRKQKVEEA